MTKVYNPAFLCANNVLENVLCSETKLCYYLTRNSQHVTYTLHRHTLQHIRTRNIVTILIRFPRLIPCAHILQIVCICTECVSLKRTILLFSLCNRFRDRKSVAPATFGHWAFFCVKYSTFSCHTTFF